MKLQAAALATLLAWPAMGQAPDPAFNDGLADRTYYEQWFAGLSGPFREGALFWAGQRSAPQPRTCNDEAMPQEWRTGCVQAQIRLGTPDARRRSDPRYRQGWNSYQPAAPQQAVATPPPTIAKPAPAPAPAPAALPPGDFNEIDIPVIVASSRGNEIRFNRDYRGRQLVARGVFRSASETWTSGEYLITVRAADGGADCVVKDSATITAAGNWASGQPVLIRGIIRGTLMGDVRLAPGCQVEALPR